MRMLSRRSLGMASAAVTAGTLAALTGGTALASSTAAASSPATAVTYTVGKAAQAAARSFWTTSRMESATPAGQAAPKGTQASTAEPPEARSN